ncbi:MAG: NUDIX pyrophosphatase [Candidatus Marinimicrobia bacterium]|nr:NUDIX pyrophosphatase [Candidatus Neomarinimicrobiota bacterium]MBL7022556.1 NUDIX pyrophosphatase [Candidatus Neomarinimicrobiota bacterium]MBL7108912.1 NUDIX pyrophosphatase [Candidatus Neomarinimicrobiota bacterium]
MTNIVVRVIDCHIVRWNNDIPEFLLLKRADNVIYPGIWQCVTGKIEQNEKPYQTAIRELHEETGLQPQAMWTIDQVNHYYEAELDRMNFIPIFGVEVSESKISLSDEHTNYKWCPIEEASDLLLWTQQKNGLLEFHNMLTTKTEKLDLTKVSV